MNPRWEAKKSLSGYRGRRCRTAGAPDLDLIDWAWYQVAVEADATEPRQYEETE